MGKLVRSLTTDGSIVASALDATDMVARAEQIHGTSAVVTAALGRLLTAASLMGFQLKGRDDSVTLRVDGGGPAGRLIAVSDSEGCVRGYATHPVVEIPLRPDGKLNVGGAVGTDGLLYVLRDSGGPEPYSGCTPLISGEIAEDITSYFATSEQIPTVCALGVLVNPDLTVRAAGGLLVQLLPFCPEEAITRLEQNVASLDSMTAMLDRGLTPEGILQKVLAGFDYELLDTGKPVYRCTCSRKRVLRAFSALPPEEIRSLPDEKGMTEAVCHFCNAVYRFTSDEMEALAKRAEMGTDAEKNCPKPVDNPPGM